MTSYINNKDQKYGHQFCAVVVAFYPDRLFFSRIQNLLSQFCKIIIVDNGTGLHNLDYQMSAGEDKNVIEIIRNKSNVGIARALNQGTQRAIKEGFAWIAFFDQDSLLDKSALESIRKVIDSYPDKKHLLIIGCNIEPPNNKSTPLKPIDGSLDWIETEQVITSGSVISSRAFAIVGKFNELLFIDYVDIDYCLRVKHHGYKVVIAKDARLYHEIGNQNSIKVLNRIIHPTNHTPERRYYQFRNSFLLFKSYFNSNLQWVKYNSLVLIKILTSIVLFESDKLIKLLYIAKGMHHGILGRAGKNGEKAFTHSLYPMK